jgi:mannose-6-phosphate isomerase-like protein (cupin superfamily)
MIEVIDLSAKFGLFSEHWRPRIVGELNDGYIKLARLKGEFVWHRHEREDEMFLVIQGSLVIKLRGRDVTINPGQFVIIPKGVDHLPIASEEVLVMLLEPKSTVNTGGVENERTVAAEWI